MFLKPVLSLVAAALLVSAAADPAFAQRGRGGGDRDRDRDRGDRHRNDDRGRDWDRGRNNNWDRDWNRHHHDNDWNLRLSFGVPYYRDYYAYRAPAYYNAWGLGPYECRVAVEFDYWYGRPADIQIRRCADAYGNVYVVQGSQRLYRYRY
jgi:hypothetical protein